MVKKSKFTKVREELDNLFGYSVTPEGKSVIELAHKYKMEEIAAETEGKKQCIRLQHECDMEMQRIRNASIQRNIAAKSHGERSW